MFERTTMLIGEAGVKKLQSSHVAVFGIGGVGSFAAEALIRCGVGKLTIIDHDVIAESNINRQLHATRSTVGKAKVDVMKERLNDINPSAEIIAKKLFYMPDTEPSAISWDFDYVADAVDTVTAKIHIIMMAKLHGIGIISSMGTGNKLNPAGFMTADIYETSVCPLAKVMRKELRKRGIEALRVVYSQETPSRNGIDTDLEPGGRTPGSVSFVPPVAGMIIAGEIIKHLIKC